MDTADVPSLVRRLEEGVKEIRQADGWRRYLRAQAMFHGYSWGNVILILTQRPDATRVAGYRAWQRLDRHVRRGEHGIRILAPLVRRVPVEEGDDDPELEPRLVGFRIVTVFDIAQTDGEPLPEPPVRRLTNDSERGAWLRQRLLTIAETEGVVVERGAELGPALGMYLPREHRIRIAGGLSSEQEAKTLVHELAHALLHRQNDTPRELQEAEAEGTAFVVAAWAGISTEEYSFGYIADWAGKEGEAMVRRAAGGIQRAASWLIGRLDPVEEQLAHTA